jgi:hypothetical protein
MIYAHKCLCIGNGIIALLDVLLDGEDYKDIKDADISFGIEDDHPQLRFKNLAIPIPDPLFAHLIATGHLYVYAGEGIDYIPSLICSLSIPKDDLLEFKGALQFMRQSTTVTT